MGYCTSKDASAGHPRSNRVAFVAPLLSQILVLLLRESQREEVKLLLRAEGDREGQTLQNAYFVAFVMPDTGSAEVNGIEMPRKTLLNALGDLCQTR